MNPSFENTPRRNKYELWIEILNLCSDSDVHLSRIMRDLRLRTDKCKTYLTYLIQKELIHVSKDEPDGRIVYRTTPKGQDAVKDFLQVLSKYFVEK